MEDHSEEDDVKLSFRGALAHFAYAPSPPPFPLPPPPPSLSATRCAAAATAPDAVVRSNNNWAQFSDAHVHDRSNANNNSSSTHGSSDARIRVTASRKHSNSEGRGKGGGEDRLRTGSRSPKKKRKMGYAAPDTYAHLKGLQDNVAQDLDVLFCGINPGQTSAVQGHHYAHPTNHFWRCLHLSGFTPRLLPASEDFTLPGAYNLGLTNLVERPSISETELSSQEMASSVPALLAKLAHLRPRVVCFVGKGIWLHVERSLRQQTDRGGNNNNDDDDDGDDSGVGGGGDLVTLLARRATETGVMMPKDVVEDGVEGEIEIDRIDCPDAVTSRPAEAGAEAEITAAAADPFGGTTDSGTKGNVSVSRTHHHHHHRLKNAQGVVDNAGAPYHDHFLSPWMKMTSAPARGSGGIASRAMRAAATATKKPAPAAARSAFAYGLQPYKAVHDLELVVLDAAANKTCVRETLFCVLPSTSGRVVSHQHDDKVALFRTLRENLESIKAGTLDTGSMRLVRLPRPRDML
ncbi:hypothetical protein BJV74DRAFT_849421 [Russula compacta]|nr:hypothetical protein BJV74DRAFT_849421 [Russula compacta]